jgi:endogenous inhibitor of DNA gyrase (YacG/DUF329 family)
MILTKKGILEDLKTFYPSCGTVCGVIDLNGNYTEVSYNKCFIISYL